MDAARKLATYEDLLALPDDVRAEILAGEIVVSPSSLPEHGRIQSGLGGYIGGPFDRDDGRGGPGGWWLIDPVERTLESLTLTGKEWTRLAFTDGDVVRIPPFEAIELDVGRLFPPR